MGSDRARFTYDPTRLYRSVVTQQGRVTLEADVNEASTIASEAQRQETIDIVGPAGTPDDGYKVGPGATANATAIGPGTMYVGGWRLTLPVTVDTGAQPDWLNMPPAAPPQGTHLVALLVTEQAVSAVEDQALREVALGGPDTGARTRLMQHFLRLPMTGNTCSAGATQAVALLAQDGAALDSKTLQVTSSARLLVGFATPSAASDPCSPAAEGGYLGADNQLVRVTVIAFNAAKNSGILLWSWNNASFQYRATAVDPLSLSLSGTPVDGEHAPQQGQAVEVLRAQADLGDGNFVSAGEGFVTTLAQGYSFDTGVVALNDALPADYMADNRPLLIRLWQATVPFNGGQPTLLDSSSGLTVTITMTALPSQIAARPFWHFAVRPKTPVQIYPLRYLQAPQPPEGPRQWLCDLAVVQSATPGVSLIADCRLPFLPLTQLGGKCCGLVLGPQDVAARGGLQAVVDSLAGAPSVLSLRPGTYQIPAPLLLGKQHNGLTLEGCTAGAILQANPANLPAFRFGLAILQQTDSILFRRLEFDLPNSLAGTTDASVQPTVLVGLTAVACSSLTIEDCHFVYAPPSASVFGAGIHVVGVTTKLTVRGNRFGAAVFTAGSLLYGVLVSIAGTNSVSTSLDDGDISGNQFQNLAGGVVSFAQLGMVRCTANRVTGCAAGFYFAASNLASASQVVRDAATGSAQGVAQAALAQTLTANVQARLLAGIAQNTASDAALLPAQPGAGAVTVSDSARAVLAQNLQARGSTAWTTLATPLRVPSPAAMTGPAASQAPTIAPTNASVTSPTVAISANLPPAAIVAGATPAVTVSQPPLASTGGVAAVALPQDLSAALDTISAVGVAVELGATVLVPVLELRDNDVVLAPTGGAPGIGIGVLFSPRDDISTVMLTSNRVLTPDINTTAAALLFPNVTAVTGNVFLQSGTQPPPTAVGGPQHAPALVVLAQQASLFEVVGNLARYGAVLLPARATTAAATSWDFLNAVG